MLVNLLAVARQPPTKPDQIIVSHICGLNYIVKYNILIGEL